MRCTDLLIQDHKTILRALDVLERMSIRVENGQQVEPTDVEALLDFFRAFADDHHQLKEESALFPELMRACSPDEQPALKQMLFEHDQERSLVEAIEDALRTKKGGEFVYFANRFVTLIRNHIHNEDRALFEIVKRLLSREQDRRIVAELEKFQTKDEWFSDLRRLEEKYAYKAA